MQRSIERARAKCPDWARTKNVLVRVAEQSSYGGVVEATSLVRTLDVKVEISRHGIVACGRWVAQLPSP
jgi:hypothetical protein